MLPEVFPGLECLCIPFCSGPGLITDIDALWASKAMKNCITNQLSGTLWELCIQSWPPEGGHLWQAFLVRFQLILIHTSIQLKLQHPGGSSVYFVNSALFIHWNVPGELKRANMGSRRRTRQITRFIPIIVRHQFSRSLISGTTSFLMVPQHGLCFCHSALTYSP